MSEARFRDFHNLLRVLTSIDMSELVAGGVIEGDDEAEWAAFRKDPHRWLIRADDDQAEKLWAVIERRAPDNIGADLAATKTELAAWKQHASEQFERARTAEQALWQFQYPTARAQTLRAVAEEIDCDLGCPHMGQASPCTKYEKGEFCGATFRAELLDLAEALERKAAVLHAIETAPAMLAALRTCRCPGGGWNGMPADVEPTVENCMAAKACGCDCGAAVAKATGAPRADAAEIEEIKKITLACNAPAVNAHDTMLAALRLIVAFGDDDNTNDTDHRREAVEVARAAIAAATGAPRT